MLRTAYHESLERARAQVLRMGALSLDSFRSANRALQRPDMSLAGRVVVGQDEIDALSRSIEAACIEMIWKQQPIANELREIAGMLQIASDLERVGQYTVEIARAAIKLVDVPKRPASTGLTAMSDLALAMLSDAIRAYTEESPELADAVIGRDDELDNLHRSGIKALGTEMEADPAVVDTGIVLLFVLANLERTGDRAQNIAWKTKDIYAAEPLGTASDGVGQA